MAPADVVPVAEEAPAPGGRNVVVGEHALFAKVDPVSQVVTPGSSTRWQVEVRNTGSIVEHVQVGVQGLPEDWWSAAVADTRLDTDSDTVIAVEVHPPQSSEVSAGPMPFGLVVWSVTEPALRVVIGARLLVEENASIRVEVDPAETSARKQAALSVGVTNAGNVGLRVRLGHSDSADSRLHLDRVELTVPPGRTERVAASIVAEKWLWKGSAKRHASEVEVLAEGGERASAQVHLSQTAVLPTWFNKAAALTVVVLLLPVFLIAKNWWDSQPKAVPNVVGAAVDQAVEELEGAGFTVQMPVERVASDKLLDAVLEQSPAANEKVSRESAVVLTVSDGPAMVTLPAVEGRQASEVTAELTGLGLEVQTIEKPDAEVPPGTVITMTPAPSTEVGEGAAVTLTVSTGPAPVEVPPVQSLTESAALEQLGAVGLVGSVTTEEVGDAASEGRVLSQDPPAGAVLEAGSQVRITVGQLTTSTTVQPGP